MVKLKNTNGIFKLTVFKLKKMDPVKCSFFCDTP